MFNNQKMKVYVFIQMHLNIFKILKITVKLIKLINKMIIKVMNNKMKAVKIIILKNNIKDLQYSQKVLMLLRNYKKL